SAVDRLNYFLDNITKPANALELSYFTVTPLPPASGAGYEEIPFSITVAGNYAALADYLYQLEYGQDFIVRDLAVTQRESQIQADFRLSALLLSDPNTRPAGSSSLTKCARTSSRWSNLPTRPPSPPRTRRPPPDESPAHELRRLRPRCRAAEWNRPRRFPARHGVFGPARRRCTRRDLGVRQRAQDERGDRRGRARQGHAQPEERGDAHGVRLDPRQRGTRRAAIRRHHP